MNENIREHPPASAHRWLVLAIVSVGLLLIVVDMTVLYTALPRLTHDLAASASQKLWIINAYPLVVAGLLPGAGTLGDRIGHKSMFVAGLMVFGLASVAAAFSTSPEMLIATRALLAVGAAMMMPATLSIIRYTFEDDAERALAIGIWAAIASGGVALGPVVGGVLLEHFWWGSVFLINAPIVLLALPLAWRCITPRSGDASRRWDGIGSLQIMVGMVAVAYAIKELGQRSPSWLAVAIACGVGGVFITVFARRQRRRADPLIDFTLFRNRRFSSGVATALMSSVALIGMLLVYVQRLQLVEGLSPLDAAWMVLPVPLAAFVAGPLAGLALRWVDAGKLMAGALGVSAVGVGGLLFSYEATWWLLIPSLALIGLGLGAAMTGASSAILLNAPVERAGMAASVEEVSYELGAAIGVALLGSVLAGVYSASMMLPEGLGAAETALDSLDDALLVAETLPEQSAGVLISLAYAAFDKAFIVTLVLMAVLLAAVAAGIALAVARGTRNARTAPRT